ncbi:hypothetical protein LTR56_001457 [Elasticomyces elasticus]|nr:hypothetical protein LTR56_001457 [Elasticomyces elasticus]KAK3668620.1 hypothetical protein LTR22_000507 [Elasticomyces elasticus]KAK4931972.1 hypothetical protein LTR49_001659 [Elasticomyces elasticus]KAK5768496.1 hypothetical protein LTS12_001284 [Elasticomyces elasticus]
MAQHGAPEYDVIIIGGGTSGCVLANRLSEDANVSVLVLEAGEDRSNDERIYTPGLIASTLDNPEFDWQYVAEPAAGMHNRRIKHPRGRVIGGTSAINSFALIYPSAAGINAWAELGNVGWDWTTLAPYYLKFQTIVPPNEEVKKQLNIMHSDEKIRRSNGPIQASFPMQVTGFQKLWVDTFRTLGLDNVSDPLDGHALGGHTSTCHITGDKHERSHAGVAYLDPVRSRTNLTVITNALVRKLMVDQDNPIPVVSGVVYSQDGVLHEVRAKREVILAAGTFNTPQILEISGIGNPDILQQHGIDVVYANPAVGENLQDHIRPGLSFELNDDAPPRSSMPVEEARRLYQENRSGPWAEQGAFAFAYMPLVPFLGPEETQELKTLLDRHLKEGESWSPFIRKRNAFIREVIESADEASAVAFMSRRPPPGVENGNFITLNSMLSHPCSAGSAHISSADPETKPKIDFNYYSHPLDVEIHGRHVQALEKLARTEPLASCIKPGGRRHPNDPAVTIDSAIEFVRNFSTTNYHPCGTCSLGAVVDSRLNVNGVRGLRIVDASIMPIIPRGNMISTVYAVAERAADIISEDLGIRRST